MRWLLKRSFEVDRAFVASRWQSLDSALPRRSGVVSASVARTYTVLKACLVPRGWQGWPPGTALERQQFRHAAGSGSHGPRRIEAGTVGRGAGRAMAACTRVAAC